MCGVGVAEGWELWRADSWEPGGAEELIAHGPYSGDPGRLNSADPWPDAPKLSTRALCGWVPLGHAAYRVSVEMGRCLSA